MDGGDSLLSINAQCCHTSFGSARTKQHPLDICYGYTEMLRHIGDPCRNGVSAVETTVLQCYSGNASSTCAHTSSETVYDSAMSRSAVVSMTTDVSM